MDATQFYEGRWVDRLKFYVMLFTFSAFFWLIVLMGVKSINNNIPIYIYIVILAFFLILQIISMIEKEKNLAFGLYHDPGINITYIISHISFITLGFLSLKSKPSININMNSTNGGGRRR